MEQWRDWKILLGLIVGSLLGGFSSGALGVGADAAKPDRTEVKEMIRDAPALISLATRVELFIQHAESLHGENARQFAAILERLDEMRDQRCAAGGCD